jgi:hypothetical protein
MVKRLSALAMAFALSLGLGFAPSEHGHRSLAVAASGKRVVKEQLVYFNTKSFKYHSPDCQWAHRCTKNCISIPKSEAIQRGGVPCKVCGGG